MIDKDEAIRLLRKEVANKGEDFIYQSPIEGASTCVYFYNGQPSCIVGHAVADAGLSPQLFEGQIAGRSVAIPDTEYGTFNQRSANVMFQDHPGLIDEEASKIFQSAQSKQDNGHSWGVALKAAELEYRRLGGTE